MKCGKKGFGILGLALLAVLMIAVYAVFAEKPVDGQKQISIEVIDDGGNSALYELQTDALYLEQAMEKADGLHFSYTIGPYGATVHTVNDLRADYEQDKAFWAFYCNGEYCSYGISQQPVEDGDAFQIVYTPA